MHVLRTSRPPGWATQTSAMEVHHGKLKIWLASREVCGTDMISITSWLKSLTDMESWSLCHSWEVEVCGTDMIKNRFKVCVCVPVAHTNWILLSIWHHPFWGWNFDPDAYQQMLKIRHWAQFWGDFKATKAAPLMWNACPKAAVGWVHGELVTTWRNQFDQQWQNIYIFSLTFTDFKV